MSDGLQAVRDHDAVEQARQWLAQHGVAAERDLEVVTARQQRGQSTESPHVPQPTCGDADAGRVQFPQVHPAGWGGPTEAADHVTSAEPADRADPSDPANPVVSPAGPVADPLDPNADPEAVARTIVLRKLAAQARTRAELSLALQKKRVPTAAADAVLDRMEEIGLVNDQEFADNWVESRQQRRHLSRSALRRELTSKGVERDEIDSALAQVGSEDELSAARSLAAKKARSMAGLDRHVSYRRLAGMLSRRGFTPGVVSQVVREALDVRGD